jgi:2-polyprenyl-3-methyl-5-hydroxy-6-metoxy-1,4-benzoquinol methylase
MGVKVVDNIPEQVVASSIYEETDDHSRCGIRTSARPLGLLGGMVMGLSTGERNAWTLSLLDLRSEDHLLDVGCGPGALIKTLAAQVTSGIIAGVDLSPVMLRQAAKRNAKTIRAGRVRVKARRERTV